MYVSSNVLQPNPPHKNLCKKHVATNTLLQPPQKIPSSSLSFKTTFFFTELCGLFWVFVVSVRVSQRKQESKNLLPHSYFFSFSFLAPYCIFSLPLSSFFLSFPFLFLLVKVFSLCSLSIIFGFFFFLLYMMKMKGVAPMEASPYPVYEDARTRFKHQSLIQDYQELEKETGAMKNRMQIMQQKKLTLLAEVRFLRRRYRYLDEKQPMKSHQMQRDHPQLQNHDIRKSTVTKGKKYRKKESAFRYPAIPLDLNQKVMNYSGMEVSLQKSAPVLVLNQKVKNLSVQEASVPNFRPTFDLNQQERIHSGKEAAKRKNTPVFDLNQISGEEEEFQANLEPFRREEPKKGLLRSVNEEQHNDMKLLVCRNIGNGSNRAGKRKITWQDQVALRV